MILADQLALTPAGKPVDTPIPVALVVVWVIPDKTVLMHKVGVDEAAPTVLATETIIVPVAYAVPQPPVNGML